MNVGSTNNDTKKLTTKDWFDKEKKDKNNMSPETMKEEINKLTKELERTRSKLVSLFL
jgi:hypothetical protein